MLIPKKLKIGDMIGIVSPSGAITKDIQDKYYRGVEVLKKMGFRIKFGENVMEDLNNWGISAGTPEQKANDINKMFVDNEVKAILCSRGGETSNAVLDLLDYKVIRQNPKIFCGFSDNTTLINAIYNKTGLITFYGDDVRGHFGHTATAYTRAEFLSRFVKGYIGEINKNSLWEEVRGGKAKGRLVGGNLSSLEYLVGTEYFPKVKKAILFFEGYTGKLNKMASIFYHFKKLGVWDKVNGVIVGYIWGQEKDGSPRSGPPRRGEAGGAGKPKVSAEDILLEITKEYNFPILKVRDFGHRTECTPLPVGVKVKIDTRKLSFRILENYVK